MVSTPEGCNDTIPITYNQYDSMKNPIARKSLRPFSETLDFKHRMCVRRLSAAKSRCKAIIIVNAL